MSGTATVLRADARSLPLSDSYVDLVVTSPPYFALRSYTDGGGHYASQIGAEPTPREYIASLVECTREWMRVLKPSGSIWVNLGDKYAGANATRPKGFESSGLGTAGKYVAAAHRTGVPNKSLVLLPERYRIAAVDQLGLIARAVVIWSKPNGLPESVTDRVRRSHEDWVHLTKLPRYFSAVDEIREQHTGRLTPNVQPLSVRTGPAHVPGNTPRKTSGPDGMGSNPLGKLPGSVWTVPTEPLTIPDHLGVDHFAAFPTEWPRRIISGWSPSGICVACGEGRRPVTVTTGETSAQRNARLGALDVAVVPGRETRSRPGQSLAHKGGHNHVQSYQVTGYSCDCPEPTAPTRPAVVLDPFGGTGTTALVAKVLGRHGISVDRSADYCRLAKWRVNDPGQIAKAMRVPPPPKALDGQGDLFAVAS
jgi:DNA modification methylase